MYKLDFMVKYKEMEIEFENKIEKGENEDLYDLEDVYSICEELYRHDFFTVFNVDNIQDNTIEKSIRELWGKMKQNNDFLEIVGVYKEKLQSFLPEIVEYDCFIGMFNYELFHIVHRCICQMYTINKIEETLLHELRETIECM